MGFRPERISIAKITVDQKLGRHFLNLIGQDVELEIIDLVKTANIEPIPLSSTETQIIELASKFNQIIRYLDNLGINSRVNPKNVEKEDLSDLIQEANALIRSSKSFIDDLEKLQNLKQEKLKLTQIIEALNVMKDLEIKNVQEIGLGSHFYAVIGYIKGIHHFRLEMSLDQLTGGEYIFKSADPSKSKSICLIGVIKSYRATLDRLLSSMNFNEIILPTDINGTPEEASLHVKKNLEKCQGNIIGLQKTIEDLLEKYDSNLRAMKEQLDFEQQRINILRRTQLYKEKYVIWAWIPKNQTKKLFELTKNIDSNTKIKIIEDPKLESHEFPTKVQNNIYSKPFEGLVNGFGPPGYNEWDPTKFLSIMIPIFFGIMFADVIDGFIVLLLGIYGLRLRASKYSKSPMLAELQSYLDKGGPILCYIGATAMFFGFLFGSYRGLAGQHTLDNGLPILWFSPEIEGGQFALLELAIFIGCIVIAFALLLQFISVWKHDKYEAIFLPGMFLLFYIGLVLLIFTFGPNPTLWLSATDGTFDLRALQTIAQYQEEVMLHHDLNFVSIVGTILESLGVTSWGVPVFQIPIINLSYPISLVIFPLILTTIYHFKHGMDGISEWLDYVITSISNTISFARIFAYTMVHGSLSLVFIQIFELMFTGNPLPGMVIGGFIVIPLELLVSFLQSLRLSWVEFFGKLNFQGSGYLFHPFKENRTFTKIVN